MYTYPLVCFRLQERRRLVEKDEESEKRKFEKKQKELKLAFEKVNNFVNNQFLFLFIFCVFRR